MALLALVIAVGTGSAFAAATITGADVVDESLTYQDIAPGTIGSVRIADNSLTGADINESTLPVTSGFSSHNPDNFPLSFTNDYGQVLALGDHTNGASSGATVALGAPGNLLATASVHVFNIDQSGERHLVRCRFGATPVAGQYAAFGQISETYLTGFGDATLTFAAGAARPAGRYYVNVGCQQLSNGDQDSISFLAGNLIVSALPRP
ncbi:MAG TPA: hypothetical protein VF533_25720 [Solirubrobacteraceae bacterium]